MRVSTKSRATKRAKPKPTALARSEPSTESAKATGFGHT